MTKSTSNARLIHPADAFPFDLAAAERCHGAELTFPGRPDAGGDPWDWWAQEYLGRVDLLLEIPDGTNPDGVYAMTNWYPHGGRSVTLHYRLTEVQRRAALVHEMHHLAAGGVCRSRCPQQEAVVVAETARWLIPDVAELAERLRTMSIAYVAAQYLVPRHLISDRLAALTPAEQLILDEIHGDTRGDCEAAS